MPTLAPPRRYHVTILSLLYAGWSLFIVLQLATRAKQGATAVVAPAITVFTEAFLLLNFNATVRLAPPRMSDPGQPG